MQTATPLEVELDVPTVEMGRLQAQVKEMPAAHEVNQEEAKDHFIQRNGVEFAGTHLLLDRFRYIQCVDKCYN